MLKQTIVWTALPHGIDGAPDPGANVRLSAFAAPRLWDDDGTPVMKLSQFPDFLDWPDVISGTTFKVEFGGGPTLDATVTSPAPESARWKDLFKADTDVIPFRFEDLSGADILTFSAIDVHETIVGSYQEVATNPVYHGGSKRPDTDDLVKDPGLDEIRRPVRPDPPWVPGDRPSEVPVRPPRPPPSKPSGCLGCLPALILVPILVIWALIRRMLKWLGFPIVLAMLPFLGMGGAGIRLSPGGGSGGAGGAVSAKKQALDDLRTFLAPTSETPAKLPTTAELDAIFDFHKMIAALGDYPELLRRMGLVVDLTVTVPAGGLSASGTIRIHPTAPLALASTNFTPKTHYDLGDESFVAAPRQAGADFANGLLRLEDGSRFAVHQVDVAGSGIKLQNAATNIVGLKVLEQQPVNGPDEQGLPALATAGISVVRPDVRSRLREVFRRMHAINHGLSKHDKSPHAALAAGVGELPDTDELFLEDVVRGFRIDIRDKAATGWLSLHRRVGTYVFLDAGPAGSVTIEDEGLVQSGVTEPLGAAATRVLRAHETLFTWDGWSLAAPRPGDAILPDTEPPDPENPDGKTKSGEVPNTAATSFRLEVTFEAVQGSLPRLRYGDTYRIRARVVDLAGNSAFEPGDPAFDQPQPEVTPEVVFRRFEPVGPPPVMLKAVPKEGESLETLTVRSAVFDADASIRAQATERHLAPPKSSQLLAERHGHFDAGAVMQSDAAAYDKASREAGSLTHGLTLVKNELELLPGVKEDENEALNRTFWLQENDSFEVSYLPDPFARGVLLRGLPGMAGVDDIQDGVNRLPFLGTWPDLKPMRLRVTGLPKNEAPAAPAWTAATRVLTVGIAQGETVTVLLASYFQQADLEQMGVWDWTVQKAPPDLAALRTAAVEGRNWLHLPYRTLTLIHAVQQPLEIPAIASFFAPVRGIGDTAALIDGTLDIDAKSTGKLDVSAAWTDPIDNPDDPLNDPVTAKVAQKMHVRELVIPDPTNDAPTVKQILDGMAKGTPPAPGAPNPPPPPPSPGLRHAFGDTKYHEVIYSLIGTSRFREHFPQPIADDPTQLVRPLKGKDPEPWPTMTLDIPNSARPATLRPVSILPTFHWSESVAGTVRTRERRGGGLRVYVERPWFLTGAKEEVGVVVKPDNAPMIGKPAETLQKYTSEWAIDPLWNAAQTAPLQASDFANGTPSPTLEPRLLAEVADPRVHVIGFTPVYDSSRKMWFADIQFDVAKTYFPFVRLALARYHPISIDGAHLSTVVQSDYVQLPPHRFVDYELGNVTPNGDLKVTLRGPGHGFADAPLQGGTVVVARLERREHGDSLADEPLGWTTEDAIILDRVSDVDHEVTWQGTFSLGSSLPSPLRVSVVEAQALRSDAGELKNLLAFLSNPQEGEPASGALAAVGPSMVELAPFGYRIVFADATIALL